MKELIIVDMVVGEMLVMPQPVSDPMLYESILVNME